MLKRAGPEKNLINLNLKPLIMKTQIKSVTFNEEQQLFVIPSGNGYSCLGLKVCLDRAAKLAGELGKALPEDIRAKRWESAMTLYEYYQSLVETARQENLATGWRTESELVPELMGMEGKRLEIVHQWESGETETVRFWLGKTSGFIPCHLEIKTRRSLGGGAVCLGKIKSIRTIKHSR